MIYNCIVNVEFNKGVRNLDEFYLLTFNNVNEAMKCEKLLKEKKVSVKIVPTPTVVTRSCGLSARIDEQSKDKVIELIRSEELAIKEIYLRKDMAFTKIDVG